MRAKLLFIMGIILTHGALGAVWLRDAAPQVRPVATSCINSPVPLPYFEPRREILALYLVPAHSEETPQP
jgi:hypothetical protein